MVEGARLEIWCVGNGTVGSNPTLSATSNFINRGNGGRTIHTKIPINKRYVPTRRGVRVVEGAALEMLCSESYRGFESRPLRHDVS